MILPRALRPGARVALVAPAGPLPEGGIERAAGRVRSLGWEPVVGANAGNRNGYLAGSDEERLADFNSALRDSDIDAIWALRGGYGIMRLLPHLDLSPLREQPRPVIGFSDNTALHLAIHRQGLVSFHGPHPALHDLSAFSIECFKEMISSLAPVGLLPFPEGDASETLVSGAAVGPLVGGNLSLIAATMGTPYQIDANGAILFLEEVSEPAYRLDRLLTQLLLGGVLHGVAGVAVGAITECPDEHQEDIPSAREVVMERLGSLGVPLAMGFPFGHVRDNWTLPVGVRARLDASGRTIEILDPAVEA